MSSSDHSGITDSGTGMSQPSPPTPLSSDIPPPTSRMPQSEALSRVASLAPQPHEPRAALREMLAELMATFAATAGAISLLNPNSGLLETEVQSGLPDN